MITRDSDGDKYHFRTTMPVWPDHKVPIPPMIGPAYEVEVLDDPVPALLPRQRPRLAHGAELPQEWVLRDLRRLDLDDLSAYASLWETYGPLIPMPNPSDPLAIPHALLPQSRILFPNWVFDAQLPLTQRWIDETSASIASRYLGAINARLLRHHFTLLRALGDHLWADQHKQPVAQAWESVELNDPIKTAEAAWFMWIQVMNAAIKPMSASVGTRLPEDSPPLYTVAALQLFNIYVEGLPIRACGNDNCINRFQLQNAKPGKTKRHRTLGVKFCTHECADAQGRRERYRKRRKEQR